MLTFLDVLEQKYNKYVKTDFYIMWTDISLLRQTLYCEKGRLKSLKDDVSWNDRHAYTTTTFWFDRIAQ